jgi:predicted Zn-dependent protease with MMP-like domain
VVFILITIEEVNTMLDEIAEELPEEIFRNLNGGISLSELAKKSKGDPDGRLYTLGEYRRDQMGRYIIIYYGSLCAVYGKATHKTMRKHLRNVLTHELTHHLESLAGERALEIKDEMDMHNYLNKNR